MNEEYKIKELEEELEKTKQENSILKEKLKNYTAPPRSKTYYENHKDEIINKNKEYKKKRIMYMKFVSPEKKKEYAKTAQKLL